MLVCAGSVLAQDDTTVIRHVDPESDRKPLFTVSPVYPEKALRERLEGEVQVCFEIDRDGRPFRIAVRASSHRVFEKPSKLAVRASTWLPLAPDQPRSGIKTCRTFRYELEPIPVNEVP